MGNELRVQVVFEAGAAGQVPTKDDEVEQHLLGDSIAGTSPNDRCTISSGPVSDQARSASSIARSHASTGSSPS